MRIRLPGMTLVALLALASCDRPAPEPVLPPLSAQEISAEALWNRITVDSDYSEYSYWPGHEGERPGQSPHGAFHRIFVNRTLLDALPVAGRVAPDGTLIVKENLNSARELAGMTVMAKINGVDPENGDWYWASYMPDGTVRAAGSLAGCITCHQGVASNDYVIVRPLDAPTEQ